MEFPIIYSIPIRQLKSDENSENFDENETEFYFDSSQKSLFTFSNLNFNHVINDPFQLIKSTRKEYFEKYNQEILPAEEIISTTNIDDVPLVNMLYIHLKYDARITFYNCTFINNTKKQFLVSTQQNSVAQFLNCKFQGDFLFVALDNSIIIRE